MAKRLTPFRGRVLTELSLPVIRARLERAGHAEIHVQGYSMWPTLWPGARVCILPAVAEQLRPGDLVLYEADGLPVLHRLVAVSSGHLIFKGDNRTTNDQPVPGWQVLGRVSGVPVGPCVLPLRSQAVQRLGGRVPLSYLSPIVRRLASLHHLVAQQRA